MFDTTYSLLTYCETLLLHGNGEHTHCFFEKFIILPRAGAHADEHSLANISLACFIESLGNSPINNNINTGVKNTNDKVKIIFNKSFVSGPIYKMLLFKNLKLLFFIIAL